MATILVFNATGAQGTTIAKKLMEEGNKVIAPVRSAKKIDQLIHHNIEAFLTDFTKQSLVPFIRKADQVVLQIPAAIAPTLMVEITSNALNAIKEAGYPKTVFVVSSTIPKRRTGRASVDARLMMKNLAHEILPNTPILSATEYLENFSTAYREAILHGNVIPQTIPRDQPVNYLSWQDLAEYVAAALKTDNLSGNVYPIGGKEGLTGNDVSERLGKVLNKQLTYLPITHTQLAQALTPILGLEVAKDYAEFYEWQDSEGAELLNPDTAEIRRLLNVQLLSFESWAGRAFA